MALPEQVRKWATEPFYEPGGVLRAVGEVGVAPIPRDSSEEWRALDGTELKQEREWLDATVFTYGVSQALGIDARIARLEEGDFDFLIGWSEDGENRICPVQLKQLVSAERNPDANLSDLLAGLAKYSGGSETIVAVKLSREMRFDPAELDIPEIPFRGLWFFGSSDPIGQDWFLYGDVMRKPHFHIFRLPS